MSDAEVKWISSAQAALQKFQNLFSNYASDIVRWTPYKDGSLKIELTQKRFFVFLYLDERTWKLESLRYHLKHEEGKL